MPDFIQASRKTRTIHNLSRVAGRQRTSRLASVAKSGRNDSKNAVTVCYSKLILKAFEKLSEIIAGHRIQVEVEVLERRTARRFSIGWDVTVTVNDGTGSTIGETGRLENLSSNGAFLFLSRSLDPGTKARGIDPGSIQPGELDEIFGRGCSQ